MAVAREKALAVRRAQKVERLKAEAARLEAPSEEEAQTSMAAVDEPASIAEPEPPTPPQLEPVPKPKCKKKAAAKQADPVVVVEQSSEDEDTFDAPPGVIFVKRRRNKAKAEPPPPPPTAEDVAVDYAYRRMVNGEFHMGLRR